MPPPELPITPAMGTVFEHSSTVGGSGSVNAKLRLLTQQMEDMKTLLAGIYLSDGSFNTSISGLVVIEGDLGSALDPASAPGASGSINAKLRLMTAQLDRIALLVAETSGTSVVIPNPIGVSGTVTVNQGASGTQAWCVKETDGANATLGAIGDGAVIGNQAGTISAKLRGLMEILGDVWDPQQHLLRVSGGGSGSVTVSVSVITVFSDYDIALSDTVILVDATTGQISVTLPSASGITGQMFYVKKIDGSGNYVVLLTVNGETIDRDATVTITVPEVDLQLCSDGQNWEIL